MDAEQHRNIAEQLIAARHGRIRIDVAGLANAPARREDCYAIQQHVAAALGPVNAFKTGRAAPGDIPIMAPIPASTVRPSGASFSRDELSIVGIELEIAFLIDSPLPDPAAADFAGIARRCVSPIPAIEVVDTRLTDPDAAGDLWQLADNQSNGGLVFGTPAEGWTDQPLDATDIELTVGGKTEFSGRHEVPGGDAFDIFCAFAAIIGDHCGGLVTGHIVTTGSLMGCLYIEPGQKVRGTISGLGPVEVDFT